ncbi:MAG TPA: RNA methyltransferase [Candidatus Acidoferrales bacterium]|nr:RNA methyltransferase [Candidatus Acidoferrales bacterium]
MASEVITSRDNKWLKSFRAALQGTGPKEGDPLGIEGRKLVEDALGSGLEARALLVSESGERDLAHVLDVASQSDAGIAHSRIFRTTDKLFSAVSGTEAPQGIAALFNQPVWGLEDALRGPARRDGSYAAALEGKASLVVVMTAIQDPGNVGTIVRSAEAFGATGAIATKGTADPWSPKALRASAGSALRLPVLRGLAVPVVLAQLRISGAKIVASSAKQPASVDASLLGECLAGPVAIFVGSEGAGLPAEVEHAADARIVIPMSDRVESLNAGVAASIVLYEAAKLRSQ